MKQFCLVLGLLVSIAGSSFAWERNNYYGIPRPESTFEKVIWVTGSVILLGAGLHTMTQNPNDNTTFGTGLLVTLEGTKGLEIAIVRW